MESIHTMVVAGERLMTPGFSSMFEEGELAGVTIISEEQMGKISHAASTAHFNEYNHGERCQVCSDHEDYLDDLYDNRDNN